MATMICEACGNVVAATHGLRCETCGKEDAALSVLRDAVENMEDSIEERRRQMRGPRP